MMVCLTADHYRATMGCVCRFVHVQDDILVVDRVHNLRLHGIRRHVCRMENLLGAREHGLSRLRSGLAPAGLFCMEVYLFSLFLLWIPRAAEFQEFAGQWWQSVQQAHTKTLASTHDAAHIGDSPV